MTGNGFVDWIKSLDRPGFDAERLARVRTVKSRMARYGYWSDFLSWFLPWAREAMASANIERDDRGRLPRRTAAWLKAMLGLHAGFASSLAMVGPRPVLKRKRRGRR